MQDMTDGGSMNDDKWRNHDRTTTEGIRLDNLKPLSKS